MGPRGSTGEERMGVALMVLGGFVIILSGLWYLEVIALPMVLSPGIVLSVLGLVMILCAAYLLQKADAS